MTKSSKSQARERRPRAGERPASINRRTYPSFAELEVPPASPAKALFHVIPVPYEKTVSYGTGTARGPRAIIEASAQMEVFDGKGVPAEEAGIFTHLPVDCGGAAEKVLARIATAVAGAVVLGKVPIVLGGEHTVTFGAATGLAAAGHEFGVVQFDAHADLRDSYRGVKWSHACVMRHILDAGAPLFQIGVRSLSKPEADLRVARRIGHLDAVDIAEHGLPAVILPKDFPRDIYLTFDIDALDPALVPGTGTPEPGGLAWFEALRALRRVLQGRRVLGFDVVEVAPLRGSHVSEFTAARLIYEIMGMIVRP